MPMAKANSPRKPINKRSENDDKRHLTDTEDQHDFKGSCGPNHLRVDQVERHGKEDEVECDANGTVRYHDRKLCACGHTSAF